MANLLYQIKDQHGEITVTEQAGQRILSFGSSLQQSAIYFDKPYVPVHEYTQIMLLGLIFVEAKHITILGLGGGGLVHCLSHYFPHLKLQAVELRQDVIDVAYQWFNLPNNNVEVYCDNAFNYIQQINAKSVDIIFSDLYEAQGMSEIQTQLTFITAAYNGLSENSCLIINYHRLPDANSDVMLKIKQLFSNVFMCDVFNGNWVLYCIRSEQEMDSMDLKLQAVSLAKKVKLPMKYYYKQLRKLK